MKAHQPGRLQVVDALRGFALMGVFLVHMVEYFDLYWLNPQPGWVHTAIFGLFGGKAYALFALLFGVSYVLMKQRSPLAPQGFRLQYSWRMTLLMLIGYLHSLLYSGDILMVLAVTGWVLVLSDRLPFKWRAAMALFLLMQGPAWIRLAMHWQGAGAAAAQPRFWGLMGRQFALFAQGDLGDVLRQNALASQLGKVMFHYETGRYWTLLGLSMAGVMLARSRFIESLPRKRRLLAVLLVTALLAARFVMWARLRFIGHVPEGLPRIIWSDLWSAYVNLMLTAAWASSFALAFTWAPLRRMLAVFVPCGRMSLTIYVGSALVFVPLFYSFGLGWHESIGQENSLLLGFATWLAIVALSHRWFAYFQYGPLEWLWRKGTLRGGAVPWRRQSKTA